MVNMEIARDKALPYKLQVPNYQAFMTQEHLNLLVKLELLPNVMPHVRLALNNSLSKE